jgi:hypothetical protein
MIAGGEIVSLRVEIADKGGRPPPTDQRPRGLMKNLDTIHRSSATAADFLRRSLAGGALTASELEVKARGEGLLGERQQLQNAKAFKTAKRLLGIKSARHGFGKAGVWTWRLPLQPSSPSANPPPPPLAQVHLKEAPSPTVNTAGGLASDLRGRCVPPEWVDGIASLDRHRAPKDVPLNRWRVFVDDCQRILLAKDNWAERAAMLDWDAHALFGCRTVRPLEHLASAGLLWAINGGIYRIAWRLGSHRARGGPIAPGPSSPVSGSGQRHLALDAKNLSSLAVALPRDGETASIDDLP